MPQFIPEDFQGNAESERKVFNALNVLDDSYVVFHSTKWKDPKTGYEGEGDFLICHPDKGILVLEVKGGLIAFSKGKVRQINTADFSAKLITDPLEQADRTKYYLILRINQLMGTGEYCFIESVVWFSGGKIIGSLPPSYDPDLVLTIDNFNFVEKSINNLFDLVQNFKKYRHCLSQTTFKKVIDSIAPDLSILPNYKDLISEYDKHFFRLTNQQFTILDILSNQNNAVIEGAAGTGKTVVAIEKARRLKQENGKVLFLCYNRDLCDFLAANYSETGIEFKTFHLLATELLGLSNVQDYDLLINNFLLKSLDGIDNWQWDNVVIDEGQDFEQEWLEVINDYTKNSLYIFYDPNQDLYKDQIPEGILQAKNRYRLTTNCRNTKQIAEYCSNLVSIEYDSYLNEINGTEPDTIDVEDEEDMIQKINAKINECTNKGISYKDIVILSMKGLNTSKVIERQMDLIKNVRTTTARKFKGLESPFVFICEIDRSRMGDESYKKLLYVASSRAKIELSLFVG